MSNPWPRSRRLYRKAQLFPALEAARDINRGEQRLAAEVALAVLSCRDVPSFAHQRACGIFEALALA